MLDPALLLPPSLLLVRTDIRERHAPGMIGTNISKYEENLSRKKEIFIFVPRNLFYLLESATLKEFRWHFELELASRKRASHSTEQRQAGWRVSAS